MTRHFILICILVSSVLLISCNKGGNKVQELPEGILSPHDLSLVLADFAIADCAANMNIKNVPIHNMDTAYAFNPLVDHGIRRSQYDSALLFYSAHPELYKQVYDSVLVLLSEYKALRANSPSN